MKKTLNSAWPYLLLSFLVLALAIALDSFITIKIMNIVDFGLEGNLPYLKEQVLITLIVVALSFIFNMISSYTKGLYLFKSLTNGKNHYLKRLFAKNINEFQAENNAKYLSTLTNDLNTIEKKYLEVKYEVGDALIGFVISFLVIASVSIQTLLLGIGVSVLCGGLAALAGIPLQKHEKQRSTLLESYTSYIKEALGAFQIIKVNDLGGKVKDDFYNKSKDVQDKGYQIDKVYSYIISIQQFFSLGATFGIAAVTAFMAIKGSITAGAVILIVNNMGRVIFPLMNLGEKLPQIFSVKSLFEKIDESLENRDNHQETVEIENFQESITFKNVSFAYDEVNVLKNINVSLKKGEKYLLVGPSGGGKSTLLKLLRKYFNPTEGQIFIDGVDLREVQKRAYFKNIANVEQHVFLFEDTLLNNITLYKEYTEKELEEVLKRAGLIDFVANLPQGLETMIYDNGKNISGGEKSRIALARGLFAQADLIFLDEAFQSLDKDVAKAIEQTLLSLEGITVVNVSHVTFTESEEAYDEIWHVGGRTVVQKAVAS